MVFVLLVVAVVVAIFVVCDCEWDREGALVVVGLVGSEVEGDGDGDREESLSELLLGGEVDSALSGFSEISCGVGWVRLEGGGVVDVDVDVDVEDVSSLFSC